MAQPIYQPTSQAAGVAGSSHTFTYFRGAGGVSLHPLQRTGAAPATSHDIIAAQSAPHSGGLGGARYPAATVDMTLPPVVPIAGSPRDGKFMV